MSKTTQITRVRYAFPLVADRRLTAGTYGWSLAPMNKALAVNDVAHFRSGRPLA